MGRGLAMGPWDRLLGLRCPPRKPRVWLDQTLALWTSNSGGTWELVRRAESRNAPPHPHPSLLQPGTFHISFSILTSIAQESHGCMRVCARVFSGEGLHPTKFGYIDPQPSRVHSQPLYHPLPLTPQSPLPVPLHHQGKHIRVPTRAQSGQHGAGAWWAASGSLGAQLTGR